MTGGAPGGPPKRGPKSLLELRFPARADRLKDVRSAIHQALGDCVPDRECLGDLVLAIDEACQNIIRHAYGGAGEGDIVLEIHRDGDRLELSLRDFAPPIDPSQVKPRELENVRPGGLGTHFIRQTMDEVVYQKTPDGEGNLLRMVKRIG